MIAADRHPSRTSQSQLALLVAVGLLFAANANADVRYPGKPYRPNRPPGYEVKEIKEIVEPAPAKPAAKKPVVKPAPAPAPAAAPPAAAAPAPTGADAAPPPAVVSSTEAPPLSAENMATAPKPTGFSYSLLSNVLIDELNDTYLYVRTSKEAKTTKAIPVPRDRALLAQCIVGGKVEDLTRNTLITVKYDPTGVVRPEILIQTKPEKEHLVGAQVSTRAGSKLFVVLADGSSRVFQIEGGEAAWKEALAGHDPAELVTGAKVDIDYDPSGQDGIQIRVTSKPAPPKEKGCTAATTTPGSAGLLSAVAALLAVLSVRQRRPRLARSGTVNPT